MLKILTCELLTTITLAVTVVWSYQILKPVFRMAKAAGSDGQLQESSAVLDHHRHRSCAWCRAASTLTKEPILPGGALPRVPYYGLLASESVVPA